MSSYLVSYDSPVTPGIIANLGPGDRVRVTSDTANRHDWAPMASAIMAAFFRGANVVLERE